MILLGILFELYLAFFRLATHNLKFGGEILVMTYRLSRRGRRGRRDPCLDPNRGRDRDRDQNGGHDL